MESQFIIMVVDPDDPKRVEITSTDSATQAARMVETMLEAGFDQSRIRIIEGVEVEMQVAHRPVVSLVAQDGPPTGHESQGSDSTDPADELIDGETSDDKEPFVQNGVRFSSLFKPAQ